MMVAVFASLFLSFVLELSGRPRAGLACLMLCLGLAVWLFLFEIYSPEYGFRMPWLQVRLALGSVA